VRGKWSCVTKINFKFHTKALSFVFSNLLQTNYTGQDFERDVCSGVIKMFRGDRCPHLHNVGEIQIQGYGCHTHFKVVQRFCVVGIDCFKVNEATPVSCLHINQALNKLRLILQHTI
jgi:hypothetical protein